MNFKPYDPFDSIAFLTIRVGKLLINHFRQDGQFDDHGLLPHHMGILVDLWTRDGVRQQDLASSIIRDKASITRALNSLEELDLVLRTPDSKDKRIKRIFLTRKGKALKEEVMPGAKGLIEQALDGIEPGEVETCKRVLRKMYENLNT